jgi:hypothetical protein
MGEVIPFPPLLKPKPHRPVLLCDMFKANRAFWIGPGPNAVPLDCGMPCDVAYPEGGIPSA